MLAKLILPLGFLIISFAATVLADEAVESPPSDAEVPTWTLRYKFVPDQKLRYRNIENVTLDAMQGENRKVDVTGLEQRRIFTVSSVEESGAARLTMQYEFVRMQSQTNDFEPVLFDTTMESDDIPPEFRTVARQLKGSAPNFWISSLGSALRESDSPDGFQPVEKGVARAGNVTVEDKKPESDTVQQAVATKPAATKEASESSDAVTFLMPLPENPVAVGDTWRETLPVNVRVTAEISRQINILRTFRLESVENGIATISFRSSVEAAVKTPTMRAQLIKATPKGTLTFDIDRGVMVKRELRYDETVLNAIGPNSVVLCNGTSTEELLENTSTDAAAE
ncbi:MAG: DUF6263 family protein [Planctomycetaceae bacterium]